MEQGQISFDLEELRTMLEAWIWQEVLTYSTAGQAVLVTLAFVTAYYLAPFLKRLLSDAGGSRRDAAHWRRLSPGLKALSDLSLPIIWALIQWISAYILQQLAYSANLLIVTTNLLTAWIVIRFATHFVTNRAASRLIAITAWTIAALNIVGLLDDTRVFLSSLSFPLGTINVTALAIIESIITLVLLLWLASFSAGVIEQRLRTSPSLTPSIKVLIGKLVRVFLIILAVLVAMGGAGIDLTALTIFSGAVGIGVGFGLQKIIANFISGIILLLDKSVKPGDIIVVGETFGSIDKLNARYVSVITRDGTEHLIPNEELITQRVENWSYSHNLLRLRIPVGVAYDSNLRQVMALCVEAASECDRILQDPEPKCLLKGFGDSSVELELRVWINDPQNGRSNLISQCLLKVWDKFQENNVVIPFPQRDLHIRSADKDVRIHVDSATTQSVMDPAE